MAGSSCVLTSTTVIGKTNPPARIPNALELLVSWVADDATGAIPDLAITDRKGWWITKIVTNPGTTGPTANYDITLIDSDGADLADGAVTNRSATATEQEAMAAQIPSDGFTLTFAGNSVNSATGTVRIFLNK